MSWKLYLYILICVTYLRNQIKLTNAAVYFVMKNMFDDATIRKEKVKELIDNGKIVFLIDNIDISNANHTVLLFKVYRRK